jgi:hypothetical protein
MKKLFRLLVTLLEFILVVPVIGLFAIQYLYPDILIKYASAKQIQLVIMASGAIAIAVLSQRKISLFWRIVAILMSLLIVVESYLMSKCSN